ncbi:concanavalin A-like lectin/glucanase domain-containing protein [Talaromyces proteolyticus]|uniref:Crh-like protein n=1 Tax=Talaromyces proteolyticus TaxID=1131652 RepID=A0AAD4KSR5_9EURO|nr:concanavalin A-like lectin/glucanase domain-containing protein [Talaromyces proteolyticus]KAH8698498.1 concanavalin A-like lectin/glucanase domain-containing protein [Talaromyces proteolyticus]
MSSFTKLIVVALAAVSVPFVSAQTYTNCNPLDETCSADSGLSKWSFYSDFTTGDSAFEDWNTTAGTVNSTSSGAAFVINEKGDAPTIKSNFYFFFGYVEVKMKIASGTGIISSIVFESDDLDEIDWEGIGTYNYEIETNYFGKDNTTTYDRATYPNVTTPADTFHTYAVDWTSSQIEWFVDGVSVRTLAYEDALDGKNFPQTPMTLRIGIWAGGDPDNGEGTIEWAGGETDYSDAPFSMYVESVKIINYNPADTYTYSDKTGDYTSIKLANTTSSGTTTSSVSSLSSSTTSSSSGSSTGASTATSTATSTGTISSSNRTISSNSTSSTPSPSSSTPSSSTSTASSASFTAAAANVLGLTMNPVVALPIAALFFFL